MVGAVVGALMRGVLSRTIAVRVSACERRAATDTEGRPCSVLLSSLRLNRILDHVVARDCKEFILIVKDDAECHAL